jgi:predicted phage-related endonuclease
MHLAPQRSPEWFKARLGRLTGSRAGDMLAVICSGEAAARRDYRTQLVVERLTGVSQADTYINTVMQRGIDCEAAALAVYEALTGQVADPSTGFLGHSTLMAGCSVDGSIDGFEGILEIKAPKSSTHLRWIREGTLPSEHLPQIQHNLWITGAAWCDFLSFDDRFPVELSTVLLRVYRDEQAIASYEKKALAFLAEVDHELAAVRELASVSV